MKKTIAKILNIIGIVVMVVLILICIPFTLPKVFGIQLYEVKTESMEPTYPVGSVVYIKPEDVKSIGVGDIITFTLGTDTDLVMTHRVIEIIEDEQSFITKGDANPVEDAEPVKFNRVIGKPILCLEGIAFISNFINSSTGVKVMVGIFALILVMWLISDQLKKKERMNS